MSGVRLFGRGTTPHLIYGIVADHGGFVKVRSFVGQGTTFDVFLPVCANTQPAGQKVSKSPSVKGSERVLLVDDDPNVIRIATESLERLGYQVTATVESIDALRRFRMRPNDFDIVITDQIMPSLNGLALAVQLRKVRRDIPIVVITGCGDGLNGDMFHKIGIQGYLAKPFLGHELAQIVRTALE